MSNRTIKFRQWYDGKMYFWGFGVNDDQSYFSGPVSGGRKKPEVSDQMQFTGLHDKNGKEIYEGDVLADDEMICGKVSYCDSAECIYAGSFYLADGFNFASDAPELEDCNKFLSVIGNIYETPELLECDQ